MLVGIENIRYIDIDIDYDGVAWANGCLAPSLNKAVKDTFD
jgi:hypothetical protein